MKKLLVVLFLLFSIIVVSQTTVIKYFSFDNNNDSIKLVKTIKISENLYKIENHNKRILFTNFIFKNRDSLITLLNKEKIYFSNKKKE